MHITQINLKLQFPQLAQTLAQAEVNSHRPAQCKLILAYAYLITLLCVITKNKGKKKKRTVAAGHKKTCEAWFRSAQAARIISVVRSAKSILVACQFAKFARIDFGLLRLRELMHWCIKIYSHYLRSFRTVKSHADINFHSIRKPMPIPNSLKLKENTFLQTRFEHNHLNI